MLDVDDVDDEEVDVDDVSVTAPVRFSIKRDCDFVVDFVEESTSVFFCTDSTRLVLKTSSYLLVEEEVDVSRCRVVDVERTGARPPLVLNRAVGVVDDDCDEVEDDSDCGVTLAPLAVTSARIDAAIAAGKGDFVANPSFAGSWNISSSVRTWADIARRAI